MDYINGKIYRLRAILLFFSIMPLSFSLLAQDGLGHIGYKVKLPIYQDGRALPVLIMYGEKVQQVGIRYELHGVRLDWIGETLDDLKGTVTTPFAVYNKTTKKITGNQKIKYRSPAMNLDGLGFDIDQVTQIIHIRTEVKVVLKEKITPPSSKDKTPTGKVSLERTGKGIIIEPVIEKKETETKNEREEEITGSFDWSGLIWFFVLFIISGGVILILLKRKRKRDSGNSSGRKI